MTITIMKLYTKTKVIRITDSQLATLQKMKSYNVDVGHFIREAINLNKDGNVTVYYLLSDFLLAFMFVRVFFLMRACFNYTMFMDVYSKKLCKSCGFTANVRFAYKCFLKKSPGKTVFGTVLFSILILAYLLRLFEWPYGYATGNI